MALYELSDEQNNILKNVLKKISFSGDLEAREKFNFDIRQLLSALEKPIQPAGKKKEIIE